ncbi:trace amine-associated receptor 13c-like [Erpetoichthys calabaricus]|uniref:trace amine-associated receptor 13c-like n=1 Tax=Erpetoichthys calabaricus TaxID=27687 RepID=UPI002234BC0E|nr:trace amine-associated receptor 13c-like [Erpetoichthys calabaricus]
MALELQTIDTVQYCFEAGNVSCLKEIRPTVVYVVLYIFSAAVVMLTIWGNLFVMISIFHFKQLHTPTNLLVLSLAVADFLVGATVMPFTVIRSIEKCWYFGSVGCTIHSICFLVLTAVSIGSLVLIAIDRYFAICHPFFYSAKVTIPVTCIFIAISWTVSLFYSLSILYFKGYIDDAKELNICPGDCAFVFNTTWGTVDMIVTFIIPFLLMILFYTLIFIVAKKHARLINNMSKHVRSSEGRMFNLPKKSETKAAITLGIVVIVFILCWVPYYISTFLVPYMNVDDPSVILQAFSWVAYCNSSMNPIIYALFYPWFQKSVKLIITFKIYSPGSSLINLFPDSN